MNKKLLTCVVSSMMLCATSVPVFAAEHGNLTANETKQLELVSEGANVVTPRSSISGYANHTVSPGATGVIVPVDASGIGGAGATITTSASSNYSITVIIWEADGVFGRRKMGEQKISSNGTFYFNNMLHNDPGNIVIEFIGLKGSVNVQAWIYG